MDDRLADIDSPAFLTGGGEMGSRMRVHDWSASPIGRPDRWPQPLKTLVDVMLASKQPMFIAWGDDRTLLYNDGYAPMLGTKHPDAMSRGFFDVWPEVNAELSPVFDRVFAGEPVHEDDISLVLDRGRGPEEAHFAYSYTPVRLETGEIAGLFSPCLETTEQVRAERHAAQERQRLTDLFEQSLGFMAFLEGPDHRIVLANPAYLKLVGHREVLGRTVSDALPDAVAQGYLDLLDNVRSSGEAYVSTGAKFAVQASEDGPINERYLDFVYQPIIGQDSQVTGIFVEGSDVTERKRAEDHLHLMVNELNHRVKNSLATVIAIAAQTFRDPDTFERSKADFTGRIITLAAAHDLLTESNWSGATMRQVIDRTVGPHGDGSGPRFDLDGPHVRLDPKMALSLPMAIHELCTNAVKYGALSVEDGHVDIVWRVDGGSEERRLLLTWIERDGPTVEPPTRRGFGSRLIERSLAAELDGAVEIRYEPTGVVCTIDAPLPAVT